MDHSSAPPPGENLPARQAHANASSPAIHYRRMTLLDIPQVHTIDKLSFALPWPERSYQYEISQNENSIQWVAEALPHSPGERGRISGMIVVWVVVDEAHVATIAVHPDFRGLGLSKKLLARGLQAAMLRGAIDSTLEVRSGNRVAQKLYEQFGYQVVGVRERYYRDNYEDALLMTVTGMDAGYLRWLESVIGEG